MKTLDLSTAAFIVGALGASFAACSAQSTGSPPRGSGAAAGTAATSGGTGNGTGGSTVIAGGNTTSTGGTAVVGTAGTSASSGGTFSTGAGGTTPVGTAGTAASAGGATGAGCGTLQPAAGDAKCCVAAGMATDLAIDDFEDGDNTILPVGNRQGYWYTYADATATEMPNNKGGTPFPPTAMAGHPCSLTPIPPACAGMTGGTKFFGGVSGSVMPATMTVPTYAGMGVDFNNHFAKSCPYGAGAYKGITFWTKGTGPFKVAVKIPTTTPTTSDSGTCAAMCEDHFAIQAHPTVPDNATWSQVTVLFTDLKQAGWGTVATFSPASLIGVQFQVDGLMAATAAAAYAFAIDDIAFM